MGTRIKKPHCFIVDDITVVTAENPVVSFLAAHTAISVNNDKVICNRHTVQAAKIISQRLSHERILGELIDFVANSLFDGREFLKGFNEIVRVGLIHQKRLPGYAISFRRFASFPA